MSKIVDTQGRAVSSNPEAEAATEHERALEIFRQATKDPTARGRLMMQLAQKIQELGLLPLQAWVDLIKADEEYEAEFQRYLTETTMTSELKLDIIAKRELSQKCARVFVKIKPLLTKAMKAEKVDKRFISP